MKIRMLIISLLVLNGCKSSLVPLSSSKVGDENISSTSEISNIEEENTMSSSLLVDEKCNLTFKYAEKSGNRLIEVEETDNYTFIYEFAKNHEITFLEYREIDKLINQDIPNNQGGYYVFDGYYSDLDMNKDPYFTEGFLVDNNYTFYYTFIGGPAVPPRGPYKLNIIDPSNYIYDKPSEEDSCYYPGEIVTLHSYPIMDADLAMYIDNEFYSIQKSVYTEEGYIWEYSFEMLDKEITISFKVIGDL